MEKIQTDFISQVVPYFIYQRLAGNVSRQYFNFQLPFGYGYFLRRLTSRYNESVATDNLIPPTLNGNMSFRLQVDFYSKSVQLNNLPIYTTLISSPSRYGFSSPNAVAPNGIEYQAASRTSHKALNIFLPYSDRVYCEIIGQIAGTPIPAFFELLFEGYFMPEELPEERTK